MTRINRSVTRIDKSTLAALVLFFCLALFHCRTAPVNAGPLEDGLVAANRGDWGTAFRLWRPLADQGDAQAQNNLGAVYAKGLGVPRDYDKAVEWYRKSAEQGFAEAQYKLGLIYEEGLGVTQDYVEAHKWFNLAAARGRAGAKEKRDNIAGRMAPHQITQAQRLASQSGENGRQGGAGTVAEYRKRSADAGVAGDADAEYALGEIYYFGRDVPQDYAEAAKWYRLSADHDSSDAQYSLGYMYENNEGVAPGGIEPARRFGSATYNKEKADAQRYAEAAKWYRKSADQDNAEAQYSLGVMYENGTGVEWDYVEACKWFNLAAAKGKKDADKGRDRVAKLMEPNQIARAQQLARDWRPRLAR